jgi:hypothetical protein
MAWRRLLRDGDAVWAETEDGAWLRWSDERTAWEPQAAAPAAASTPAARFAGPTFEAGSMEARLSERLGDTPSLSRIAKVAGAEALRTLRPRRPSLPPARTALVLLPFTLLGAYLLARVVLALGTGLLFTDPPSLAIGALVFGATALISFLLAWRLWTLVEHARDQRR